MDILKASDNLSQLNLKVGMDNYLADLIWFRAMLQNGSWCIKRHTHSTYEFHFVYSGSCKVILDERDFVAEKGDIYVTIPGLYHEQRAIEGKEGYIEYSINCDFIKQDEINSETDILLNMLKNADCRPVKDEYNIINLFTMVLKEAYSHEIGFYNNICSLITMLITLSVRNISSNKVISTRKVSQKIKKDEYRFKLIEKFIEDNMDTNITTKVLASHLFLSDKQICRIIKEKTGITTKEFINSRRLKKAKELLRDTDIHLKGISEMLGFTSEYYFNQFFKRLEGFPPGEYRHNTQNV